MKIQIDEEELQLPLPQRAMDTSPFWRSTLKQKEYVRIYRLYSDVNVIVYNG